MGRVAKGFESIPERYVSDVLARELPAGKLLIGACERHRRDRGRADDFPYYFDETAGARAIRFFSFLKHSKGEWAGRAFDLAPWQQFIVWSLFGWRRRSDGLRRFRTAYVEIPRKNGKSTLAAGIGLYLFFADSEPGAEVYSAATKRDQARITHSEAERMVKASPALTERISIVRDNLFIRDTASKFEPLGADADTMDGLNIHGAILDELHAHKNSRVVDVIETATGARRQPLIFEITTAGHNQQSICWEHHVYGENILGGNYADETFFCYIAGIDPPVGDQPGDDWREPESWRKANPNWGISVKPDDLERLATKARQMVTAQNAFRRLRLDEWTEQETRWLDMEQWDNAKAPVDAETLAGKACFAGLDLSSKIDLTALILLFPPDQGQHCDGAGYRIVPFFYIPKDNIGERVRRDRVPYDVWARHGLITATPGNVVDYDWIKADLNRCAEKYRIKEIGFDPWNATQLGLELQNSGFKMVEVRQGFKSMAEPTKELEALVKSRKLLHGGHPIMRWNASNVVVRSDPNDNYMPDKAKSTERIDGVVGLLMALSRAIVHGETQSVYSKRGVMVLGG